MSQGKLLVGIKEVFEGKLIHQFRNEKWKAEINSSLRLLVSNQCEGVYARGYRSAVLSFENHIPKPKPTFKNRIKFLIHGEF
jgi:hypothetical protein